MRRVFGFGVLVVLGLGALAGFACLGVAGGATVLEAVSVVALAFAALATTVALVLWALWLIESD